LHGKQTSVTFHVGSCSRT